MTGGVDADLTHKFLESAKEKKPRKTRINREMIHARQIAMENTKNNMTGTMFEDQIYL